MSILTVRTGVSSANALFKYGQVAIIGKLNCVKNLKFNVVAAKLYSNPTAKSECEKKEQLFGCGLDESTFNKAIELLQPKNGPPCTAVPLYFNYAQILTVNDETSRYNAPSNCHSIGKAIKSLPKVGSNLSIILVAAYVDVLSSVCAIARSFPLFNSKTKQHKIQWQTVSIEVVLADEDKNKLTEQDVQLLNAVAESIRLAARLVDMPSNELDTVTFCNEALHIAESLDYPIQKLVIKGEELRERGFGGLYSVGKAAQEPPIFVCLSYKPVGAAETYALVGKGIVFDTGGMQLKTKNEMPTMKIDMGGAAAVLAAFTALVRAGFKQNLHCILCLAENNISPRANKPDDIITMLSGKTVEITNTDAEGRLVLGDGVYFAQTELKANVIINMATLTGAQKVSTGFKHAAIMSNSELWEERAVGAGRYSGDLVHPVPFCPDLHFLDLASPVADMKNSDLGAGPSPACCLAGLFIAAHLNLESTTDALHWLHVDMAGPVFVGERATGYGPALILALLGHHTDSKILNTTTTTIPVDANDG